jgi:uncharacterized protein (PEP-CTERM system associated)
VRFKMDLKASAGCWLACLAIAPSAQAEEWELHKSISLNAAITDNDRLTSRDEHTALDASVIPALKLTRNSGRISANLDAQVELSTSDDDNFIPHLRSSMSAELESGRYFLDASANITQNSTSIIRDGTVDDESGLYNQVPESESTTRTTVTVSPYAKFHYADQADLQTRYTMTYSKSSGATASDRVSNQINTNLTSGDDWGRFSWGLLGQYRQSSNTSGGSENGFGSIDAQLGYLFDPTLRATMTFGFESNDYNSSRNDNQGDRWQAGLAWIPSPRTSVNIGYGERYFGSWPTINITHRQKHSVFSLAYTHEVIDSDSEFSVRTYEGIEQPDGSIKYDLDRYEDVPYEEGVYIDESLSASWMLVGVRSTLNFFVRSSNKQYENRFMNDEETRVIGSTFSRKLSPLSDFSATYSLYEQNRYQNVDTTTHSVYLSLSRKLPQDSSLALSYLFAKRNSEFNVFEYTENRLQLSFTHEF